MEHRMNLNAEPFDMMKKGKKTIELRLYDEKRKQISVGDTIKFTNTESSDVLRVKVEELYLFDSFEALYERLPLLECGYTEDNVDAASARDMERYYSKEKQCQYGVVGIKVALLSSQLDCTFQTAEGKFNYRVCAIIIHNCKLLAMHNERTPYYFLPGGRVRLHEQAEDAVVREVKEELGIDAAILRPLWLNQSFFTEDVTGERFHELCLYYLMDVSKTGLVEKGDSFTLLEGEHTNRFRWLEFERLKTEYLYPLFLKEKIFDLPERLTMMLEFE